MDVRAVAVVDGTTLAMGPPAMPQSVGASSRRACSWSQPSPSSTRSTTWSASSAAAGNQGGASVPGSSRAGTTFEMHAPP